MLEKLKKIEKLVQKLFDKVFPPLKFKKKDLEPTDEDLDKWATEFLEKQEAERRRKRGKHKN